MLKPHSHKALAPIYLVVGLLLSGQVLAEQTSAAKEIVGEMITVIGLGKVIAGDAEQPATRGKLVYVGDRIETAAGGHVHVRFVDGALVSVRPLSRLHIEDYRNNGNQTLAAIKFKLEDGVIRSVTGSWGEANRDRFRLNTPVAAIGIKGTDFVVKADGGSTLVSVNSGAIVMSPLEGACATSLGPCAGLRTALLSADMQGQMLEYMPKNDTSAPRLVPYADLLARSAYLLQVAQHHPADATTPGEPAAKTQSSDADTTNSNPTASASVATAKAEDIDHVAVVVAAANAAAAAEAAKAAAALPVDQPLIWLHNKLDWNIPANSISTRFDDASEVGRRPVASNFFVSLYRDEITTKNFAPTATTASFNLLQASANYTPTYVYGNPPEPVSVSNAKLTADFASNTLSTQLTLSSQAIGQEQFAATATVTPQGLFVNRSDSQQILGAFSNDARQAGYLFEKKLNNGSVSGLTLWGR